MKISQNFFEKLILISTIFYIIISFELNDYFGGFFKNLSSTYFFEYHFVKVYLSIIILLMIIIFRYYFKIIQNLKSIIFSIQTLYFLLSISSYVGFIIISYSNNTFFEILRFLYYDKLNSSLINAILIFIFFSLFCSYTKYSYKMLIKVFILSITFLSLLYILIFFFNISTQYVLHNPQWYYMSTKAYQSIVIIVISYFLKKNFNPGIFLTIFLINSFLIMLTLSKGAALILLFTTIFLTFHSIINKVSKNDLPFIFSLFLVALLVVSNFTYKNNLFSYMHDRLYHNLVNKIKFGDEYVEYKSLHLNKKIINEFSGILKNNYVKDVLSLDCRKNNEDSKIYELMKNKTKVSEIVLSALSRIGGIVQATNVFINNKIFGIGLNNLNQYICTIGKSVHSFLLKLLAGHGLFGFIPFVLLHILIFIKLKEFSFYNGFLFAFTTSSVLFFENSYNYVFFLFPLMSVKKVKM